MTEILIYGIVGDSWDGLDANTLVPLISAGDADLDVRINSPGGYVMEGLAILNAITREVGKGRKVTTHIDGLAASMGSVIAMAGQEIVMADNALMMIHNPWDVAIGDAAELRRAADQLDKIRDQIVGIYGKRTGLSADDLIAMMDAETWMTAPEALEQKFVTSIAEGLTVSACSVHGFGFQKVPDNPRVTAMAMARFDRTAPAAPPQQKENTMPQGNQAGAGNEPDEKKNDGTVAITQTDVANAIAEDRKRISTIRSMAKRHGLDDAAVDKMIEEDTTVDQASAKILDALAKRDDDAGIGHSGPTARVTQDERDKFAEGAANWIMVKAGVANLVEKAAKMKGESIKIDPGEFRGVSMVDLARESLDMQGVRLQSRAPKAIMGAAFTAQNAITQGTGDFSILLENTLHKILQASYVTTPDKWSRFCGKTTVTDFRAHNIYRRGTFGALDTVDENGEFKQKPIPDGAREKLTATTKGNIIVLSRQAMINDDMGAFSDLAVDLGRAAKLTIEVDVFAYLNSNPNTGDGHAFFSAEHGNLLTPGAAPTVAEIDKLRQLMASQKDLSGSEFLEIEPSIWLGPLSLGGQARVSNNSQYDPDAANKLQRTNIALGVFSDIVDTARLTGTPWYGFADPDIAPAIVVGFLDGVEEPFLDMEEGWRVDGAEWKVRIDYGVAGINPQSAAKDAGQ